LRRCVADNSLNPLAAELTQRAAADNVMAGSSWATPVPGVPDSAGSGRITYGPRRTLSSRTSSRDATGVFPARRLASSLNVAGLLTPDHVAVLRKSACNANLLP
jgi:hypothetical protein